MEDITLIKGLHLIVERLREEDAEQAGEIRLVAPQCCAVCSHMDRRGKREEPEDEDIFICMLKGGPIYLAVDRYIGFFAGCDRFESDNEVDGAAVLEIMAYGQKG